MEYVIVVEKADDGSYSAYVPDLPGCVTSGETIDEVRSLMAEALAAHVDSLRSHGDRVPPPTTKAFSIKAA
ncbi:MAG TPA: type II toxin-antitoxin system HicB family antitoxin [Phycisphaerales bacterium]|nr:type II toxin-antitoxin system HicB family antitoxin [Phycisphaerales bacterium]